MTSSWTAAGPVVGPVVGTGVGTVVGTGVGTVVVTVAAAVAVALKVVAMGLRGVSRSAVRGVRQIGGGVEGEPGTRYVAGHDACLG